MEDAAPQAAAWRVVTAAAAAFATLATVRICAPSQSNAAAPTTGGAPAAAFVAGTAQRALLTPRIKDLADSPRAPDVAMNDVTRRKRKATAKKKTHISNRDRNDRNFRMSQVYSQNQIYGYEPAWNLEFWSQTLKLSFAEGEDDVVTEEEVMEYFTTDDFKPETVIVGHTDGPWAKQKHTYVHFATREECKKARKEKNGGPIGKASEVKVVYTDEKKWIRVRDGMSSPLGGRKRGSFMKPYGDYDRYEGWGGNEARQDVGSRTNPVYPF